MYHVSSVFVDSHTYLSAMIYILITFLPQRENPPHELVFLIRYTKVRSVCLFHSISVSCLVIKTLQFWT